MPVPLPDPPLADEAIRLVPLTAGHVPAVDALARDDDVRAFTRFPREPSAEWAASWIGTYEEGAGNGSRAGFAIESHEGEFSAWGSSSTSSWRGGRASSATSRALRRAAGASRPGRSGS